MLSQAFKLAFPHQVYKTDTARQRFLQMPVACIRVGTPESGKVAWFLVEYVEGVDYVNFAHFAEALFTANKPSQSPCINKSEIKGLLGLAQSDRERELIRYSLFKASGLTSSGVRRHFGFEKMSERARSVRDCIETARSIREAIDKLSTIQDRAILAAMGINVDETESDSDSSSDDDVLSQPLTPLGPTPPLPDPAQSTARPLSPPDLPNFYMLREVLERGQYNWFEIVEYLESYVSDTADASILQDHLEDFYRHVLSLPLSSSHKNLIKQSYAAYTISQISNTVELLLL